jgi:WD40 repeat protein
VTLADISARRGLDPRRLGRAVRGDLEWVVMKALEKDRRRRYETANGLARDIERYLHDEPVEACPPSTLYRLRKIMRRHRFAAAMFLTIVVCLVTLVIGLTFSNRIIARARDQKDEALHGEKRALALAQQRGDEAARHLVAARESERVARQAMYSARINLAQGAADSADIDRMLELLNSLRPEPGQEDLRGFEWYYLWRLCHNELLTLREFSSPVRRAVYSPDGKTLATGHGAEVKLFGAHGELLATLPAAKHQIRSLAFSPDGALLAVGGGANKGTGEVEVWDCASRTRRRMLPELDEPVSVVAFSPDGKTLATATAAFVQSRTTAGDRSVTVKRGPRPDRVRLWNVESGAPLGSFEGPTENLLSMAFSPDGKFLVAGEETWHVIVWETATFKKQNAVKSDEWHVGALSFSPDGKLLAAGYGEWSRPGTMTLFSFPSMTPVKRSGNFVGGITSLAFSPDGKFIAAGSHDRQIYLVSSSGNFLGKFLGHRDFVASVAFSPDGRKLASSSLDNTVRVWDVAGKLQYLNYESGIGAGFLADGRFVTHCRPLSVIDPATGVVQKAEDQLGNGRGLTVSPDGRLIAGGDDEGHVTVWDSSTLKRLHAFQDGEKTVWSVSFSPDGQTLASGGENHRITLRDLSDGHVIRVLQPQGERVRCVAFAPDGVHLASATWEQNAAVQIWDVASGRAGPPLEGHGATCLKYSPDGKLLAVGRQNVTRLYDVQSGRLLQTCTGHSGDVWDLAFSPDGKTLATISWDHTLRLWSVSNQQLLLTFTFKVIGMGVAFSRDGRTLGAAAPVAYFLDAADPVEADEHIDGVLHHIEALRHGGQIADADQFAARMLGQFRQRWGDHDASTARLMVERASLLLQFKEPSRYPEAESLLVGGRADLGKKLVPGHEWRWRALYVARDLYGPAAMNDPRKLAEVAAALGNLRTEPSTRPAATQPTSPAAGDPSLDELNRKAYLLRRDGHLEEALAVRQHVVERAAALYFQTDPRLAKYQGDYISLLIEMKRYEEAELVARQAFGALSWSDTASRQLMLRLLVRLYEQWPKPDEAERYRKLLTSVQAATRPATTQSQTRPATTQTRPASN